MHKGLNIGFVIILVWFNIYECKERPEHQFSILSNITKHLAQIIKVISVLC